MVQSHSEETDLLWTVSGDCLPFNNVLMETKVRSYQKLFLITVFT